MPTVVAELDFEISVLMLLEQDVYSYLEDEGVPSEEWENYMAYAKQVWERRVNFRYDTYELEKTSLLTEFTMRGLDPNHLNNIQVFAEDRAKQKLGLVPITYCEPWGEMYHEPPPMPQIYCEAWSS